MIPANLISLLASTLKGLLFQAYAETGNYDRINKLNICTKNCHSQVLGDSFLYGIDYRDELIDSRNKVRDMLHNRLYK